jgi:hypothetical protein
MEFKEQGTCTICRNFAALGPWIEILFDDSAYIIPLLIFEAYREIKAVCAFTLVIAYDEEHLEKEYILSVLVDWKQRVMLPTIYLS